MMAPMPRADRLNGPKMRRKRCSPAISSSNTFNDFLANNWLKVPCLSRFREMVAPVERVFLMAHPTDGLLAVNHQRNRSIVDQLDLHHGPEAAGRGGDA